MYIVGFNGPPESGKDTLAEMLADHMDQQGVTIPVKMESLSLPLRHIAYAMVGRTYDESTYADFKNEIFPAFGVSGRKLMIDVSESFLKTTYGITIMARMLLDRNKGFTGVLLVRDSGFQIEVGPLAEAVGLANLFITQVTREGKTFANDSREWVYPAQSDRFAVICNDFDKAHLRFEAAWLYGILRDKCNWKF